MRNQRAIGTEYERKAAIYLESKGYRILEFNFSCKKGEIDLIARDGDYLVFVEVKYRENENKGNPLEAVDFRKQRIISRCAFYYINKNDLTHMPVRFDVVGILGKEIQLIQNAFDYVI